jgi:hypothetical protein
MGRKNAVTLPIVYVIFTALTGIIDAASYLSLGHVFTANMTGTPCSLRSRWLARKVCQPRVPARHSRDS